MSFKDFVTNYKRLEICSLGPESLKDEKKEVAYNSNLFEGGWKRKVNAGGCRNNRLYFTYIAVLVKFFCITFFNREFRRFELEKIGFSVKNSLFVCKRCKEMIPVILWLMPTVTVVPGF
jgi:hypothetical protein